MSDFMDLTVKVPGGIAKSESKYGGGMARIRPGAAKEGGVGPAPAAPHRTPWRRAPATEGNCRIGGVKQGAYTRHE